MNGRAWTPQDQAIAEVAVACRVHLTKVARFLGRGRSVVEYRLKAHFTKARNKRSQLKNATNPNYNRQKAAEWYKENKDGRRQYNAANRERNREYHRKWRAANPEKIRQYNAAKAKRQKWNEDVQA